MHEWFSEEPDRPPPLTVLITLLWKAMDLHPRGVPGPVLWIGRACWPYPLSLIRRTGTAIDRRLLDASICLDADRSRSTGGDLVWSIEQAARCPGVWAIIADGCALTMAESRRLQIAAEGDRTHRGTPIQMIRPAREQTVLSASRSRWRVTPEIPEEQDDRTQGWTVELLRCKGTQPNAGGAHRWYVRREYGAETAAQWEPLADCPARDGDLDAAMARGHRSPTRSKIA